MRAIDEKKDILSFKMYNDDLLSEFVTKIENIDELFKLGKKILVDFELGSKNFALASNALKNAQQKTVLGLCCFFDHVGKYKMAIISNHNEMGLFDNLIKHSKVENYNEENFNIKYNSYNKSFNFVTFDQLFSQYNKIPDSKLFDEKLELFLKGFDLVIWDVPDVEFMKNELYFYYRISHFYDSLTLILAVENSPDKGLKKIRDFFENYNLKISNVLLDNSSFVSNRNSKKGIFK